MLQLKNIVKTYVTGDWRQDALKGISIQFRESEFVSILGQSGSGKTTMLNIIGGLDRYTSGDLVINGRSTKQYKDDDWDYYRNNSIGFVFQSYHLIPHQTVLSNVEMALTLAGVSRQERKQRAIAVLKKVGLGDHLHKRPNQMSGGQMQRVAIARALINNPDILLADEPTGALDSETSLQIMELLKEIAKDKLVIMVTHNPDLAKQYSTRIVKLLDGKIVSDSNPFQETEVSDASWKRKKISMSFFTALSLSFHNLRTKKGRTLLTSFAGSIGIIGIALILSLSTGMNAYIADVQKDAMTSYPITISAQTVDMSSAMGIRSEVIGERRDDDSAKSVDSAKVHADYTAMVNSEKISSSLVENNLTEFKKYLEDPNSDVWEYLGENGIVYTYDTNFSVYSYDADGNFIDSDVEPEQGTSGLVDGNGQAGVLNSLKNSSLLGDSSSGAANFSQLMPGSDGQPISPLILDSYDVMYGSWPQNYNEVVLVLNERNGISAETLYQLGLIRKEQYDKTVETIENGETADEISLEYDDICDHAFYLVTACDHYMENEDGTFAYLEGDSANEKQLMDHAIELKVTGVVRPKEDASHADLSTTVAYTSKLTDYMIDHTNDSAIIKAQEANPQLNVLTGTAFTTDDDASKIADAKTYLSSLGISEKAALYQMIMDQASSASHGNESPAEQTEMPTDEAAMAAAFDIWLENDPDEELLLNIYEEYMEGSTYEDNMKAFGKVSYDAPSSISIYTDNFENKDAIAACIENYNETAQEDARITYTDYVAVLTSSLTTIIDGISWLLIGFVGISLVVSCIMIGIITHISVMERTKEIGILRALGASKHNISQVFNAETFIIGCCAGLIGIGASLLAMPPINRLIERLTGIADLHAQLPFQAALILIALSIAITIIGGLIPAKRAAKKDPVIALHTE